MSISQLFVFGSHYVFPLFQLIHSLGCYCLYNAQECVTFNYIFVFHNVNSHIDVWRDVGNTKYNRMKAEPE